MPAPKRQVPAETAEQATDRLSPGLYELSEYLDLLHRYDAGSYQRGVGIDIDELRTECTTALKQLTQREVALIVRYMFLRDEILDSSNLISLEDLRDFIEWLLNRMKYSFSTS